MKIVHEVTLIDNGNVRQTPEYSKILGDLRMAIQNIVWPPGSETFRIFPGKHINGVGPIQTAFVSFLLEKGWISQQPFISTAESKPGSFDIALALPTGKYFGVEWETGNISSSHRSINRMLLGIKHGQLIGGALVLPTRKLYAYLTDRVGNYEELLPYFHLWTDIKYSPALLQVFAVEHDEINEDVPPIKKGTDGRALR